MERQQRIPPTLSVSIAVFSPTSSRILLSKIESDPPKDPFSVEFPHNLYSDLYDFRIDATLAKQPSEQQVLETATAKVSTFTRSQQPVADGATFAFLGTYESPNWGASLYVFAAFEHYYTSTNINTVVCTFSLFSHFFKYHVLAIVEENFIETPENFEWRKVTDVLDDYNAFKYRLSPPTLGVIRGLIADVEASSSSPFTSNGSRMSRYWHALAQENEKMNWGTFTHFEYAPSIECMPILSNTLDPFHCTNLITIQDGDHVMIVDPGANLPGTPHLSSVLSRFSASKMHVLLTHHHHDHIESLDLVGRHFPGCEVIGHPYTLEKTKLRFGEDPNLHFKPICSDDKDQFLKVGEHRELLVMALAGHTRGHLALWDPQSKTLVSGDHTVGFGSSVLDPHGGGNMKAYLESTRRLVGLPVEVILPCHGAPTLIKPIKLLESYIKHRLGREKEILELWNEKTKNVDEIVEIVYKETPKKLHEAAKRNVILHLEKLSDEGTITLTPEVDQLVKDHKADD